MNLWLVFLTGLTTGGLTCMAIQGGLLATAIAAQPQNNQEKWRLVLLPTLVFLIAKIIAYTLLGFLLGLFGAAFQLSPMVFAILQLGVGVFMITTALRMFDVHPVFRKFVLAPPKVMFKFMREHALSGSYFSPFILGLATVFLPCGTTQAMEIQAIGSGSAPSGASIMFFFTLGTSPLFLLLGTLATQFKVTFERYLQPVAASLILILGIVALDNGLTLAGSPFTLKGFWQTATGSQTTILASATASEQSQVATIIVSSISYQPNRLTVKAGTPVTLQLVTNQTQGCTRAIIFPTLGIQRILPMTGMTTVELPALAKGKIPFSCSMGMFGGEIEVI